ncbi:MAG: GNAT family N-acetyltransferase [Clostridia bacterium]|nr:GNAT family N-acetyltransferase [Clostridia bacterium]
MVEVLRLDKLSCASLSEQAKREICSWQYTGEYAIYNLPSYDDMKAFQRGFMNPAAENQYYGFWDCDVLVGYVKLVECEDCVSVGIGVSPNLCGKHYGRQIMLDIYDISKKLYPDKSLSLEVRTWNKRAIKCYEKAGFRIDGQAYELTTGIGIGTFYRMIKE